MHDHDPNDPISSGYRRIRRMFRNLTIVVVACVVVVFVWGMPAVQWSYRAYRVEGIPSATDKIEADYWSPFLGWRLVRADQYASGCPVVIFIPLKDCIDLSHSESP